MATKKKMTEFSVIVPTYAGEHLDKCLNSILNQKPGDWVFEIVLVIDGPNEKIKRMANDYQRKFEESAIDLTIKQLPSNQGRFEARLKGAKAAKHDQLLFIDDRITFNSDYFSRVVNTGEGLLLPSVMEADAQNGINRCLYLLRRRIYGKDKFGSSFEPFYIDENNFEKSPKGTAGLWVPKKDFIEACVAAKITAGQHASDDTKILRKLLEKQHIFKSSGTVVYYHPRAGSLDELRHIYDRGPKFVDYYLKPGTRFFVPLTVLIIALPILVVACVIKPGLLIYLVVLGLIADTLFTLIAVEKLGDILLVFFYPLIVLAFVSGIIKGLVIKCVK